MFRRFVMGMLLAVTLAGISPMPASADYWHNHHRYHHRRWVTYYYWRHHHRYVGGYWRYW